MANQPEDKLMSAKERLHKLQAALAQNGAVDVKFYLSAKSESSFTEVATDVADFLEAALINKHVKPVEALGDSLRKS